MGLWHPEHDGMSQIAEDATHFAEQPNYQGSALGSASSKLDVGSEAARVVAPGLNSTLQERMHCQLDSVEA